MRVLVCGGRDFKNYEYLERVLDYELADWLPYDVDHPLVIIQGEARGADSMAREWASANSIPVARFPADWAKHGKAAGFIRNNQMLEEGKPDLVLAFPGGAGTAMMVAIARKAGVKVREIPHG